MEAALPFPMPDKTFIHLLMRSGPIYEKIFKVLDNIISKVSKLYSSAPTLGSGNR